MGVKLYKLVHNLITPAKPATKKCLEIIDTMIEHLQLKSLITIECFKFYKRSSETVFQYLAELCKLAEKCKFEGYLDEALCDHLICSLLSEVIQRRLLGEEELSLKKALEITYGIEITNQKARKIHTSVESKVSDNIMLILSTKTRVSGKAGHGQDTDADTNSDADMNLDPM